MMITKGQLSKIIREAMKLDLEIGDVILTGKFKNKRSIVKEIGVDDKGQPTVNGRPLLKLRIEKLMPRDRWSSKSKQLLKKGELKEMNMRVTKSQLKRLIQEEKSRMLNEQAGAFEDIAREIILMTGDVESGKGEYTEDDVFNFIVDIVDTAITELAQQTSQLVDADTFRSAVVRAAQEW